VRKAGTDEVSVPERATKRQRLDLLLVERELCESRAKAQRLILAGMVVVGEHTVDKPGTLVDVEAPLRIKAGGVERFVSRGGHKLQAALDVFVPQGLIVTGRVCMDIGASTGGFTDCLLQAGAAKVHAIDVGYGQLAWKLAADAKVVVLDRQNIRKLQPEQLGEPIDLAVADCSFVSLTKVLPHLPPLLRAGADLVLLVKPQFEVGPARVGKGGIVRDSEAREAARAGVEESARALGFSVRGHIESPIPGREGNLEWLLWLQMAGGRERTP
jgi:23S rRNA (cytidine1920-2'-O)/16S rRNA (cytidine1409-2'-O)-methyltransferase